ncbi:MAG: hypothetical protein LBC91_05115 [Candidatus Accumulibacter sp.]|jgi:hypothetical protein|nr:hypothetical protein [Accumulibacter sp.]
MSNSPSKVIDIPDFQTGSELVGRIQLANPAEAILDLDRILDSLLDTPPGAVDFFRLLELLWPPVTFVAEDLAKRYTNKAVPLGEAEDGFFRQVAQIWLKTAKAYARCFKEMPKAKSPQADENFATLLYRCIYFTGMSILEYHRARREVPWGLWLDLHSHYGAAEELGLTTLEIPHLFGEDAGSTHCAAAYVSFILCDMAGSYSLSLRNQRLVHRWSAAWSAMVSLHPVAVGETLPVFVIDLMQDAALRPSSECLRTDQIRRLDTSRLATHIHRLRHDLRQRIPPSEIGLGDDCSRQQCTQLLSHLGRQWSQARAPRKFRRHATSGAIQVCTGFEEMHYFISGKPFQQPENDRVYSRGDFNSVYSLRFHDNPLQATAAPAAPYLLDTWEMVDQSANGFRLIRNVDGRKMAHGQLLALRPNDGGHFILAQVCWLMQENHGGLIVGLRALPGLPQAICARPLAAMGGVRGPLYERVFLMPALVTADAERSLVIPAGWFRPALEVEIFTDAASRVRLRKVLDSGPDFERASFDEI